jgi:hypothetical protein
LWRKGTKWKKNTSVTEAFERVEGTLGSRYRSRGMQIDLLALRPPPPQLHVLHNVLSPEHGTTQQAEARLGPNSETALLSSFFFLFKLSATRFYGGNTLLLMYVLPTPYVRRLPDCTVEKGTAVCLLSPSPEHDRGSDTTDQVACTSAATRSTRMA